MIAGQPRITSSQRGLKDWEQRVALIAASTAAGVKLYGPIAVRVVFYLTRPASLPKRAVWHLKAPDLDKLERAIGDALTNVLYADDKQIVQWIAEKEYADEAASRVVITVRGNDDARIQNWCSPKFPCSCDRLPADGAGEAGEDGSGSVRDHERERLGPHEGQSSLF